MGFGKGWDRFIEENPDRVKGTKKQERKPPTKKVKGSQPVERMNKTEKRYAALLDADDSVRYWVYEGIGVRLGKGTFYYPDFLVVMQDWTIEVHETKGGYIRQKGRAKFYAAADKYPFFRWRLMQWKDKVWTELDRL